MKRPALFLAFVLVATLLAASAAFAATIQCNGGECSGTNMADRISGSPKDETIRGQSGNDKIYGGGGRDVLKGGPGTDFVKDGGGQNILKGGDGPDVIRGGLGDETIRASSPELANDRDRDDINCGPGVDTVYYIPGQDTIENCEVINPPQ